MLATAGAGSQALAWLLGVAGASRTLIEALVPYDWRAFDDFLRRTPPQYVSPETARQMAGRALSRADWLVQNGEHLVGLACTATIVTDRPKRGKHRAHIAAWTPSHIHWYYLQLEKGARDRAGEEEMVSTLLVNVLAETFGLAERLPFALREKDIFERKSTPLGDYLHRLESRAISQFQLEDDGIISVGKAQPLLLCGSFNPLHDGHLELLNVASKLTGLDAGFEMAGVNADKPSLNRDELLERMMQFAGRWPVSISTAPTFAEKARCYPGTTFVVGIDTAARVLELRFYDGEPARLAAALEEIRQLDCRFLVAGRVDDDGRFHPPSDLAVPPGFGDLFVPVPAGLFRRDISSSELRRTGQRGSR